MIRLVYSWLHTRSDHGFCRSWGQNTRTDTYGTQHNHRSYLCSFWKPLFLWVWSDCSSNLNKHWAQRLSLLVYSNFCSVVYFICIYYIHLSYSSTEITQGPSSCHSPTSILLTLTHLIGALLYFTEWSKLTGTLLYLLHDLHVSWLEKLNYIMERMWMTIVAGQHYIRVYVGMHRYIYSLHSICTVY